MSILDPKPQTVAGLDTAIEQAIKTAGTKTGAALSATYARKFQIDVSTYVASGSTDETAAVEAALTDVAAGGTLFFPRLTFGQSYRITNTLTVTKANLRFLGGGRDAYAVNIQKTTAGGTTIDVKAPGFVFDGLGIVGSDGQVTNGVGATITGLDLYGDVDGNIDARITGAAFQYLAVGVRVRARNATIEGETQFSNCLKGVVLDGIDAVYHTGANAAQNRGNTIRGCRFHNIGGASTDAAIEVTSAAKVLHALITGNYFDSNGLGRHIVATGTSANPHKSISIWGNKHTEAQANVYDLTYVNNSSVSDVDILGYTGGAFGNGFVVNNCDTLSVRNVLGIQIGRTGFYARNSPNLDLNNVNFAQVGIDTGATYHGFDIDSTNNNPQFTRLRVGTSPGYGFTGSPFNPSMVDSNFLTCTLGRISSTTVTNRAVLGRNTFVESQQGRLEDVGRRSYDFAAGTALTVATVTAGSTYGSMHIEVEFTGRDGTNGNAFVFVRRYVRPENGVPVIATVGTDATANATIALAASGTTGVTISITPTSALYGSVVVRASAGGAANSTNPRGVTVAMA
ncbi:hypothetical protein AB0N33_00690 [Pseudarthrobacter oxydans]|uniref:hypothetical protein n=1 Tax=Pseudarthrobacter oxydans TaxID=1671 RepID=UPI003431E017